MEPDDREAEGSWVLEEERWPLLNIAIAGGNVIITGGMPPDLLALRHEKITVRNSSPRAVYEGQMLGKGSLRISGVMDHDQVSLTGVKEGTGTVRAEYFYVGTIDELLQHLVFSARIILAFGIVMMVTGAVILMVMVRP